jgi:hypothetical protein
MSEMDVCAKHFRGLYYSREALDPSDATSLRIHAQSNRLIML